MPRVYLKEVIFGGKTFCCCLPVRFGLIAMSFLGILFGGILSIICWFEVANLSAGTSTMTKAALVAGGLVETVLLLASILGFIGAIARKQSFVQTYAYILYVHFLLNVAVAIFLLVMVTKASSSAVTKACEETVKNTGAQDQCTGLIKVVRQAIIWISLVVLLVEMYGAIIAARYVNQIQGEKRTARSLRESRIQPADAYEIQEFNNRHSRMSAKSPSTPNYARDFDPYEGNGVHHDRHSISGTSLHGYQSVALADDHEGYGGGSLTHGDVEREEKSRLRRMDENETNDLPNPFLHANESGRDTKTSYRPPSPSTESDGLPRYSLSDPSSRQ
ncbi:hypothetical protein V5O48_008756 [Marasmius crinis-equi]|uniref:Uncharacterized protein n=1 Tax=Marasmius crinis-equi TaxID=585013 RepID=A0ABR3FDI0_9AGAR